MKDAEPKQHVATKQYVTVVARDGGDPGPCSLDFGAAVAVRRTAQKGNGIIF